MTEDYTTAQWLWILLSSIMILLWALRPDGWRRRLPFPELPIPRIPGSQLLLGVIVYFSALVVGGSMMGPMDEPRWQQVTIGIAVMGAGFLLASAWLVLPLDKGRWLDRELAAVHRHGMGRLLTMGAGYFLAGFGMTMLALWLTLTVCEWFGYKTMQIHHFLKLLDSHPPALSKGLLFLVPGILGPVTEELFFRAGLQQWLIAWTTRKAGLIPPPSAESMALSVDSSQHDTKRQLLVSLGIVPAQQPIRAEELSRAEHRVLRFCQWQGIIITSLIFPVMHHDWQHWPALLVLSLFFGYAYERHRSILVPIVAHTLFNIIPLSLKLFT